VKIDNNLRRRIQRV